MTAVKVSVVLLAVALAFWIITGFVRAAAPLVRPTQVPTVSVVTR